MSTRLILPIWALLGSVSFAHEVHLNGKTFQVAEDYSLQVAAGVSLMERPVEACFDSRGRLFVTESSGSNEPVEDQLRKKPHRVLRLEDSDGDGVFDGKTLYAEGLMFPSGILWHEGAVYVAAPPEIWKFTDSDDDGVSEKREVWFDGKTLTGCANDLHGPYLGPDGWIYWCKGGFAEQTFDLVGKRGHRSRAGHVFRARTDGTGMECVFTAGMDNPVGLAWTPEGDLIVSGTFLQHPGDGKRDGLIHAVRGGVWGKDHEVLENTIRTGPLMPAMTHLGPAAASGIASYGRDFLVCQFNLRTVSRHRLFPLGATWRTEDTPFLTSDHPDFHPTDVLQAPDGSILVIDTGGWYKLCCPTSQLAKPDVPGAIYRLRRTGGEVPVLTPPPLWPAVDPDDFSALTAQVQSSNLHLRRSAIEAMGQWPARQSNDARSHAAKTIVPLLLEASRGLEADRFICHAVTYALLEGGDPEVMSRSLTASGPRQRGMLLFALAQTAPAQVGPAAMGELLAQAQPEVMEALEFGFSRSADWRLNAKTWLENHFSQQPAAVLTSLIDTLSTGAPEVLPDLGRLLGTTQDTTLRAKVIAAMVTLAGTKDWPASWESPLQQSLLSDAAQEAEAAAGFFAGCPLQTKEKIRRFLADYSMDESRPGRLRLRVLSNPALQEAATAAWTFLVQQLSRETPPALRLLAAETISRLTPDAARLQLLTKRIGDSGMLEKPLLLRAYRACPDEAVGTELLNHLETAGGLTAVPGSVWEESLASFPEHLKVRVKQAQASGRPERAAQIAHLEELEKTLPQGDASPGSLVFQSAKASCTLCHAIGYTGGELGPDLSRVGAIRTRRDLLEAILYPSASFVRSYETVEVAQHDGTLHMGIIRNQSTTELTLGTSAATLNGKVELSDIKTMTPGAISLMPAAYGEILSSNELADLIAFLGSMK